MEKILSVSKGKYSGCSEKELKSRLQSEGYSAMSWQDPPGAFYSEHSHNHDDSIAVSSGSIAFGINDKSFELSARDSLVLPANTKHTAINGGSTAVTYLTCTRT